MDWLAALFAQLSVVGVFSLVLARTSGMLLVAPVLSGVEVPMQVRALLAVALAMLCTPLQMATAAPPEAVTAFDFALVVGGELLIGLMLGLGVSIVLVGFQVAGYMIGQLGGMSLAEVLNPTLDTEVPLMAQFLHLLALAIFLLLGGHRLLMAALLDTFDALPPGSEVWSAALTETLTTILAQSFSLGIRGAAPAVAALLLATFAMGVLSRTLPQLNLMSLGFGVNALATLGTLWVSVGSLVYLLDEQLQPTVQAVLEALGGG